MPSGGAPSSARQPSALPHTELASVHFLDPGARERELASLRADLLRGHAAETSIANLPFPGPRGLTVNRDVVVVDPRGESRFSALANEVWRDCGNAIVAFDPEYSDAAVPRVTGAGHPVLLLPKRALAGQLEGILDSQVKAKLLCLAGERPITGETTHPTLSPQQVLRLIDTRGRLRAVEEILRSTEPISLEESRALASQAPSRGTIMFVAAFKQTIADGDFRVHVFRDIATGAYTMALVHGDIYQDKPILSRIHSSCITSETEFACDCDCRPQLEGALNAIVTHGAGVVFYMVQEGRGAGLIPKATDRAMEQSAGHQFTELYDTYEGQGLRGDLRGYRMVGDILELLGARPNIILLTNNETKFRGLTDLGLNVIERRKIEIPPIPLNVDYLRKKRKTGVHDLGHSNLDPAALELIQPPFLLIPAGKSRLPNAVRFVQCAVYGLPVQIDSSRVVLDRGKSERLQALMGNGAEPFVTRSYALSDERTCFLLNEDAVARLAQRFHDRTADTDESELFKLVGDPDWLRKHVYFDQISARVLAVLEYGRPEAAEYPLVRVHSDSLLGRIPGAFNANREKLRQTLRLIIEHGHGLVVLTEDDGSGAGLGVQAQTLMYEQLRLRDEAAAMRVDYDRAAFRAAAELLRHHVPSGRVALITSSLDRLGEKAEFLPTLQSVGLSLAEILTMPELKTT